MGAGASSTLRADDNLAARIGASTRKIIGPIAFDRPCSDGRRRRSDAARRSVRGMLRSAGVAGGARIPARHVPDRRPRGPSSASGGAVDLRSSGSGNPGTANAANVLGAKAGAAVLVGDIGKGAAASAFGAAVAGPVGAHVSGSAAVIGHCYPVWNGFRGGKGVATSIGQCLATFPAYFPIDAAVGVATAAMPWWRQRAFAATAVSSACWVVGGAGVVATRSTQPVGSPPDRRPPDRLGPEQRGHRAAIPRRRSATRRLGCRRPVRCPSPTAGTL